MDIIIKPSRLHGIVSAPPSKSFTHRSIILASLACGVSRLKGILVADDTKKTLLYFQKLGVSIKRRQNLLIISGCCGKFKTTAKNISLFLGDSGTSLRLLTAVSAISKDRILLDGSIRLRKRPIEELIKTLKKLGVKIAGAGNKDHLPLSIIGGEIQGGNITINSSDSSQFISAILLIAPYACEDIKLKVNTLASKPYIDITVGLMKQFGAKVVVKNNIYQISSQQRYKGTNITIEGDWSSASYFLAAAAITKSEITVSNIDNQSLQGDKYILSILSQMGCKVTTSQNSVTVKGHSLQSAKFDLGNYPDLVPTVAILAAFANGQSILQNVRILKFKESNRLQAIFANLKNMDIKVYVSDNVLKIRGGEVSGTIINPYNDHRIAMSFAIAALAAKNTSIIKNANVVSKSYPNFFTDLKKLGAKIN